MAFCPPRGAQARRDRGLMAAFRKVVYIDLTKGESWIEERPEPNDQWLGGTGAGTQLMME